MSEIIVLPESVVNKIAAGEVVNSPLNAVKEMLENSLDAGAKEVRVSIERGGLDKIEVEDDGRGIAAVDLPLVCHRHATSKLCQFEDLKRMSTYGFRGEAMASISEVARVTVKTKTGTEPFAMMAIYKDGRIEGTPIRTSYPHPTGTSITVERIFRTCDARLGSIKAPDEATRIISLFYKYAIHHPDIKFRFSKKDGRGRVTSFQTDGRDDRHAVIEKLLCEKDLMDLEGADEEFHYSFHACFSRPKQLLSAGSLQSKKDSRKIFHLFINHRPVECDSVKRAIDGAFKDQSKISLFMTMALKIDNNLIDVNVSPTKEKVHFLQERQIAQHIGQKFISFLQEFNKQHTFARLNFAVEIGSQGPEENAARANAIIPLGRKRAHTEISGGAPTKTASSVRNAYLDRSNGSAGLKVSRSKSQSDWRRHDPARLRVDHRERKLQEFFPREPINSYARLQEGLRLVRVKSDNLDDSGESVDTVLKSSVVKVRDLRLTSIENLRRRICAENDPGLRRLFSKLYFVGFLSTRQALFQHCEAETSCYRFFTAPVLREFFYQVIFSFGNMGSYKLEASGGSNHAPVRKLLQLYMCSRMGSSDVHEIERRVEVLSSKTNLLWDFFSIQLVEDGSGELILRSIPCLIRHPSAYVPPMVNIPRLLYDLSAVDYTDEERCFEQVSRCVADFHVPLKLVETSRGVVTTREEEAAETVELRVTNADEKRRLQAIKDNMRHALFRRLQNKFLPPAKLRPFVRPIFGMRQACKLFHRC